MLPRIVQPGPVLLLLTGLLVGCGGGASEPTGDVVGTVSLGGNAGGGVAVIFFSENPRIEKMAGVDDQGEYGLQGLPLGKYDVYLAPVPVNYPTGETPPPQPKIPSKFTAPETSGLSLEVTEGSNQFDVIVP